MSLENDNPLFNEIGESGKLDVWMSHGDKVTELADGFHVIAETPSCHDKKALFGIQFHPEVTHTHHGMAIKQSTLKR